MDLFLQYSCIVVCDNAYSAQILIFRNAENYDKIRYISPMKIVRIASAGKVTMANNDCSKYFNIKQFCGNNVLT